jgi:hypothetical protein
VRESRGGGDASGWISTELGTAEGVRRSGRHAHEQAGSGVVYVLLYILTQQAVCRTHTRSLLQLS